MNATDIQKWVDEKGPLSDGIDLYNQFGKKPTIKARLAALPSSVNSPYYRRLLETEFQEILRTIGKKEKKITFRILNPDEILEEIPEDVPAPIPSNSELVEELETANSRLLSERNILSNRFRDPEGSQAIILENASIVDQIETVVSTMKANRQKIRELNGGTVKILAPEAEGEDTRAVVYGPRGVPYTMSDLQGMSDDELWALREKIRQMEAKARNRAKTLKKETSRQENENKAVQKKAELEIIDQIRKERKHGQDEEDH